MKKRIFYIISFLVIFCIEVFIALYVRDSFVRPYMGDALVVVLVYSFVRIFIGLTVFKEKNRRNKQRKERRPNL